jgi:miniconductance mechanosensitive channel
VQVGDWIEMPQFSADGDVIDISLNVVQVQNWDKTITVIPAHKFLEHSFRNWRGMSESGGRRIARALELDVSSIAFIDEINHKQLDDLQLLQPYLSERSAEIAKWNEQNKINSKIPGNGRRMTNVGCFRAYVLAYLRHHEHIRKDMTLMVRQQAPGVTGLPLQVYAFTNTTVWAEYERIQSDIFDHLYAVLPYFNLRVFQHPSGNDMRMWSQATVATPIVQHDAQNNAQKTTPKEAPK